MAVSTSLAGTELFQGLDKSQIEAMLPCLGVREVKYNKGEYIIQAGARLSEVGVLEEGRASIFQENVHGEPSIIKEMQPGDLFAEAFICAGIPNSPVSVVADTDCTVLHIHFNHLLTGCSNACTFHSMAIQNLLKILAKRALTLNQKIEVLTKRTTQEKLLTYLETLQAEQGTEVIHVSLNRGKLADYLAVDRSALSREIGKMVKEGMIECDHNDFRILV